MLQRMLKKMRKEEGGFTLVELLIVVAIIAILAAIAIPQFTMYRLRGFKSAIDSDTKNAYTAAQAYLTDNPSATVNSLAMLKAGGYQPTDQVSFVSANMTLGGGNITLRHDTLNTSAKSNISIVEYNGKFNFVDTPD